ncbi:MAG TPA: SRPBCC domain-containing protein [Thermoplasmata archaeon]|nr:SRPBCC domain-containing protein [Thermoplasmata archaeon]
MTKKSTPKKKAVPKDLKVERIFDASPKTLWSYWTNPAKFAKWFNPAPGLDLVIQEYDVRVGGRVRFDMPQPDGNRNPQDGVFHVVKPYRELASGAPDKSFLITVKFAVAGKRTRMTVTVTGVPPEYREGAVKGWNAGFEKLAGLLGRGLRPQAFTIERTFKAPVERMWALWTTKEGVESWWGPEGFTTTVRRLDLRPGGTFDYKMQATAPEQIEALKELGMPTTSEAHNVFTEVTPPTRLALRTRIDFIPDVAPYEITTQVDFLPVRGGTKVVFTSSKMHSAQWEELARQGQLSQLDKLARVLGSEAGAAKARHPTEVSLPSEREVLVTRVFDAPRERVFQAHLDPRAMEDWWGPREYATTVDRWEPRPGGPWRIVQRTPDGTEHGFHGEFLEILPPNRLSWTFEYEGTPGHVITETLTFEEARGGKTKLTVRAVYRNQEDRDGMLASGMEWGMRESYERLDTLLGRGG